MNSIKIHKGDITLLSVDAIVNAANTTLLGGGGVDGAIHRAAGPELLKECERLNGCATGDAKITKGYNLPARYVIHTVGPVWHDGERNEVELLESCYHRCLEIAGDYKLQSIAFPNIGTGVYRIPKIIAAGAALRATKKFLSRPSSIEKVIFVCFDEENYSIYKQKIDESENS